MNQFQFKADSKLISSKKKTSWLSVSNISIPQKLSPLIIVIHTSPKK